MAKEEIFLNSFLGNNNIDYKVCQGQYKENYWLFLFMKSDAKFLNKISSD